MTYWIELTAPSGQAITTADFKLHARIDSTDTSQDTNIGLYILAATTRIEKTISRPLLQRQYRLFMDGFPSLDENEIWLPVGPVVSVDAVKYVDQASGSLLTWSSANYNVSLGGPGRPRVMRGFGQVWPIPKFGTPDVVQIDFTAGYAANGAAYANIPEGLRAAVMFLAAHWYNTREPVTDGQQPKEIPKTFDFLLSPYKLYRI